MRFLNIFIFMALGFMGCAHGLSGQDGLTDGTSQATIQTSNHTKEQIANAAGTVGNSMMTKEIAAEILRRMPLIGDQKTLLYANTVGQFVAQELVPSLKCWGHGTPASEVRVAIVKSLTPSAFSISGGLIFVTTSLMQKMETEDEFAGVLANEIVLSVCEKGVPSNLVEQASTAWSDYVLTLPTKSLDLHDLGFADKYALVTLYRRGYHLLPYVSFIAKNEVVGRHIGGRDRAAVLKRSVDATPAMTSSSAARQSRFQAAKSKAI